MNEGDTAGLAAVRDMVHIGSAVLVGATSSAFVIGLLVVNIRLAHYGLHSLEIDRAEYVLVGAVFSALACGAFFLLGYALNLARSGWAKWKEPQQKRRALLEWIGVPMVMIPLLYSLSALSAHKLDYFNWRIWVSVFALGLAALSAVGLVSGLRDLWTQYKAKPEPTTAPRLYGDHATRLLYSLMGVITMIGLYAEQTYPYILSAYGGGQRDPVILVTTPRGAEVAKSLALPFNAAGQVGPVFVLTESEADLAVTKHPVTGFAGKDKAVEFRRELLEAIATADEDGASDSKMTPKAAITKSASQALPDLSSQAKPDSAPHP